MEFNRGKVLVLFASQTGTAEEVGERMHRELKARLFDSALKSTAAFTLEDFASGTPYGFLC